MMRIFDSFKMKWILHTVVRENMWWIIISNEHWTSQCVFPTFCLFAQHFGFCNFCIFCKDMQKSVGVDKEISLRHDASAQANCTFLWNSWDLNHWRRREAFSDNFQQNRDEQKSRENNGGSHPFAFSTLLFENYLQCCQINSKFSSEFWIENLTYPSTNFWNIKRTQRCSSISNQTQPPFFGFEPIDIEPNGTYHLIY